MNGDMRLGAFFTQFPDEATCRAFIEQERWGGSEPTCPRCGDAKTYRIAGAMGFKCSRCKQRFSVRTGTPMERSKITLQKWLLAIYILTTARKDITSVQLAKALRVTQPTAWFLEHRIRAADESYFGRKGKSMQGVARRISGRRRMASAALNVPKPNRLARGRGEA